MRSREAGASLMPLPPYSPDLTQISEMFSKLKGWLRSAAARTTEAVCPADIRGCFSSYGLCATQG